MVVITRKRLVSLTIMLTRSDTREEPTGRPILVGPVSYRAHMSTRLFYVDDSGSSESTGLTVSGWVELAVDDWNAVLAAWLEWRHTLYSTVGIPSTYELHATKFAGGRGRPTGTSWDRVKAHRAAIIEDTLSTLARIPNLTLGAAFQRSTPRRASGVKSAADGRLVRYLDARLTSAGDNSLLIMDGDGSSFKTLETCGWLTPTR